MRSRVAKNEGGKSKSKLKVKSDGKKKKYEKQKKPKKDNTDSNSGSGKDNSDKKKKKKEPKLFYCMLLLAVLFVFCLIFTIIVIGHAWCGMRLIPAFTVDQGATGEGNHIETTQQP